jgi:nitrite reductase/ring-hydroxylating ferredoxin subunit
MLSRDENERVTRVGRGTPMGETMRRYWLPALLTWELPEPDCPPVRVKLLGEELVAFRDSQGRIGLLDERCPHRQASLFLGRNEDCGLRCVYHGWKFDLTGQCVDMPNEPAESNFKDKVQHTAYPCLPGMTRIRQALISVSDKTGVVELSRGLARLDIAILSTGGTARLLRQAGLEVTEVSAYTGFPEMLDGRVKTLHPKVHAGILARRDLPAHMQAMDAERIPTIDMVVVNLYPFAQAVAKPDCTLTEAIENIDIGGPSLLRAAAKNYHHVAAMTDPSDYTAVLAEMESSGGAVSLRTRYSLARKAFSHTAAYDSAISNYLTAIDLERNSRIREGIDAASLSEPEARAWAALL